MNTITATQHMSLVQNCSATLLQNLEALPLETSIEPKYLSSAFHRFLPVMCPVSFNKTFD